MGAMHDASRILSEGITPMHRAAVVPEDEVAGLPDLVPTRTVLGRIRAEAIQQFFALLERQPGNIAVTATAQEQGAGPVAGCRDASGQVLFAEDSGHYRSEEHTSELQSL